MSPIVSLSPWRFTPGPLAEEMMAASRNLRLADLQWLDRLGCDRAWLAQAHADFAIGKGLIEVGRHGLFQFIDGGAGIPALILPAIERDYGNDRLIDLVAVRTDRPDVWTLRRGDGVLLGQQHWAALVEGWEDVPPSLTVFANPIEWLMHLGAGVCVLNWGDEAMSALRMIHGPGRQLTVFDARFGEALRAQLMARHNVPEVAVRACQAVDGGQRRAAA